MAANIGQFEIGAHRAEPALYDQYLGAQRVVGQHAATADDGLELFCEVLRRRKIPQ